MNSHFHRTKQARFSRQSPAQPSVVGFYRFKPFTKLMFSDQPIYSFYSDVPMPPRLAMLSLKRFWTGDMDNARIGSELKASMPGVGIRTAGLGSLRTRAFRENVCSGPYFAEMTGEPWWHPFRMRSLGDAYQGYRRRLLNPWLVSGNLPGCFRAELTS
jgi:hypothetical protein